MKAERRVKLPNFLIVGAAKAGTTSLYEYLKQHPDIFMPTWKELSFFIGDPHGPLHKVKKPSYYYRVFSMAGYCNAVGEASTSYLYDISAAGLIMEKLGRIKIIISLRDPVSMGYSLYNHQVRREGETLMTFEQGLAAETHRFNNPSFRKRCYGWHANYYYFRRGQYYNQVKRYVDTFGFEQVKIIFFDQLSRNPIGVARDLYRFLGVDDSFLPQIENHNPAGSILKIPEFWKDEGLLLKTLSFVLSGNLIHKIPHLLRNINRPIPGPISPDTARKLGNRFLDDIDKLEKLIGVDLSHWRDIH